MLTDRPLPPDTISTDKGVRFTLSRVGGKLQTFTAVSREALGVLGVAGSIVGAVFVIIDFVDHNWVGGGIGAAGITAGVLAGVLISGPAGWIIGGAITALFLSMFVQPPNSASPDIHHTNSAYERLQAS